MKKMFLFSILMIFAFTSQAFSLYNLYDAYATEVLLNRDDITYNLDLIGMAENVSVGDGMVLYRSHYDSRLGVTLEAVNHEDILKGLSVRLQMPLEEKLRYTIHSIAEIKDANIDDPGEAFLKSLGYNADIIDMKVRDDEEPPDDKPRPEPDLPRDEVPKPVEPKDEEITVASAQVEPVVIMDNPVDGPVVDDWVIDIRPMYTTSILLHKDNIRLTIVSYEGEEANGVEFILNIIDSQTIDARVNEDIRQIVDFYGFDSSILDQLEENASTWEYVELVEAIVMDERFDFHTAMKIELEWLRDNGIILGLTDQDISDISILAKQGISGWNSRIVFADGRWFPYYETDDPWLIRTFEEAGGEAAVIDMVMPNGVAKFATTSVSPSDKAYTKWGKIKTDF